MAGLILALICAAAADQPVPGHTVSSVVSERGPALIKGLVKSSIKEVRVLVLGFFMFLSAVSVFSL